MAKGFVRNAVMVKGRERRDFYASSGGLGATGNYGRSWHKSVFLHSHLNPIHYLIPAAHASSDNVVEHGGVARCIADFQIGWPYDVVRCQALETPFLN